VSLFRVLQFFKEVVVVWKS